MAIPPAPERLVGIADRYSRALDALERRSRRNIVAILRRSLTGTLAALRWSYRAYVEALGPISYDPARNPIRRPGAYTAAEATAKFGAIIRDAQGFLSESELRGWQITYEQDLRQAATLGGELGIQLAQQAQRVLTQGPFTGADPMVIRTAAQNVGALIQGEGAAGEVGIHRHHIGIEQLQQGLHRL